MDSKLFDFVRKQSCVNSALSSVHSLCDVAARISSVELLDEIISELDLTFSRIAGRVDFYADKSLDNVASSCEKESR